jgi:protein-tyrosine phosphatase
VIDLHAHILPALDDGAADLDESLAMAATAVADGITTLLATPHADVHRPRADVAARVLELQGELDARGVRLRLLPGAEIALSPDVPARLADRTLTTLAGSRYALVELPFNVMPPHVDQVLFDVQMAGFTPVMAHVERYRFVQGALDRLADWCDCGVILQVNASSLRGDFGAGPRRAAEAVVRSAWPAVLASDAHDSRRRRPELGFARPLVEALTDAARAAELLDAGPAAIVADQAFPTPTARAPGGEYDSSSTALAGIPALLRRLLGR